MFHPFKGAIKVRKLSNLESPYFPCRYLWRQMVVFMAHNRAKIWKHKEASLRGLYGVEVEGEEILELPTVPDQATQQNNMGRGCLHSCTILSVSPQDNLCKR